MPCRSRPAGRGWAVAGYGPASGWRSSVYPEQPSVYNNSISQFQSCKCGKSYKYPILQATSEEKGMQKKVPCRKGSRCFCEFGCASDILRPTQSRSGRWRSASTGYLPQASGSGWSAPPGDRLFQPETWKPSKVGHFWIWLTFLLFRHLSDLFWQGTVSWKKGRQTVARSLSEKPRQIRMWGSVPCHKSRTGIEAWERRPRRSAPRTTPGGASASPSPACSKKHHGGGYHSLQDYSSRVLNLLDCKQYLRLKMIISFLRIQIFWKTVEQTALWHKELAKRIQNDSKVNKNNISTTEIDTVRGSIKIIKCLNMNLS